MTAAQQKHSERHRKLAEHQERERQQGKDTQDKPVTVVLYCDGDQPVAASAWQ